MKPPWPGSFALRFGDEQIWTSTKQRNVKQPPARVRLLPFCSSAAGSSLNRIHSEISWWSERLDWVCGSERSLNKTAKTLNTNGRAGSAPARRFKLAVLFCLTFIFRLSL